MCTVDGTHFPFVKFDNYRIKENNTRLMLLKHTVVVRHRQLIIINCVVSDVIV